MDAADPRPTDDESGGRSWLDAATLSARLRLWVRWIGAGRIAAVAGATVVLGAAVWWLVRSPVPPTEARLPTASHAAVVATTDRSGRDAGPATGAGLATTTTPVPAELTVHVAGAVASPGVYVLPSGARVIDAIAAAGGALPDGDPDALNLAAPVADGDRIALATVGATPAASGISHASGAAVPTGPLDVNTASTDELDALPGVGPATAAAIVAHREANGPFASVEELEEVRGIGPAKLEALRGLVTV